MKKIAAFLVLCAGLVGACQPTNAGVGERPTAAGEMPAPATQTLPVLVTASPSIPVTPGTSFPTLPQTVRWQIQYSGELDYSLAVDVYNLDLFDTAATDIAQLRARGVFVMCYFNAGAKEDWRPDAEDFPAEVLGKAMEGWEGETWLDIRRRDALAPLMSARLDLAAQKGCDGVDPDNINGYENDTGFPLAYNDQLAYNIWLADAAHARGLAIGLKNDLNQVADLQPFFQWIINESCFDYDECHLLLPFKLAGKPVFVIEYDLNPEEFCFKANELGFNAIQKKWELDGFLFACR